MNTEQHSCNIDLVDFFQLDINEKRELDLEFKHSKWTETEECHGFPAVRKEEEISDEAYYLNGKEIKLKDLEEEYGEEEVGTLLSCMINNEVNNGC